MLKHVPSCASEEDPASQLGAPRKTRVVSSFLPALLDVVSCVAHRDFFLRSPFSIVLCPSAGAGRWQRNPATHPAESAEPGASANFPQRRGETCGRGGDRVLAVDAVTGRSLSASGTELDLATRSERGGDAERRARGYLLEMQGRKMLVCMGCERKINLKGVSGEIDRVAKRNHSGASAGRIECDRVALRADRLDLGVGGGLAAPAVAQAFRIGVVAPVA